MNYCQGNYPDKKKLSEHSHFSILSVSLFKAILQYAILQEVNVELLSFIFPTKKINYICSSTQHGVKIVLLSYLLLVEVLLLILWNITFFFCLLDSWVPTGSTASFSKMQTEVIFLVEKHGNVFLRSLNKSQMELALCIYKM